MPTIKDVAEKAGVSVGTVSRYLNGYKLKDENMKKIEKAIEVLDYKENIIAKGLKNNKSMSIGVVINTLTDVFATSIVTHIEQYLEMNNYSMILCDYQNDRRKLRNKLEFLKNRSVDGLIIFHLEDQLPELELFKQDSVPIIVIDAVLDDEYVTSIVIDNESASYEAIYELHNNGHTNIGVIAGDKETYIGKSRLLGCTKAMDELDMNYDNNIVYANFSQEESYAATKELLEKNPHITAIYSMNYYMTLGTMQYIQDSNYNIPEDISLIGFDYFRFADVIKPRLTLIKQPLKKIGDFAGKLIIEKINGEYNNNNVVIFETELLIRDSIKNLR